jgi:hypothetical protein
VEVPYAGRPLQERVAAGSGSCGAPAAPVVPTLLGKLPLLVDVELHGWMRARFAEYSALRRGVCEEEGECVVRGRRCRGREESGTIYNGVMRRRTREVRTDGPCSL